MPFGVYWVRLGAPWVCLGVVWGPSWRRMGGGYGVPSGAAGRLGKSMERLELDFRAKLKHSTFFMGFSIHFPRSFLAFYRIL